MPQLKRVPSVLTRQYAASHHNWKKCPFTSQAERSYPYLSSRGALYHYKTGTLIPQLKRSTHHHDHHN